MSTTTHLTCLCGNSSCQTGLQRGLPPVCQMPLPALVPELGVQRCTRVSGDPRRARYFVRDTEAPHIYAAVQHGELLGLPVFMEIPGDPVLGGLFQYENGGWVHIGPCPVRPRPRDPANVSQVPECKSDCKFKQTFREFARQRNALRMETASMVNPKRCGWNLLPGRIGGHPLDYSACIFAD